MKVGDIVKAYGMTCMIIEDEEAYKVLNLDSGRTIIDVKEYSLKSLQENHNLTEVKVDNIYDELQKLYEKKNKDYGDSFSKLYDELGIMSCITQIAHKYHRIINVVDREDVNNESLEDNLLDLANYCAMTVKELRK